MFQSTRLREARRLIYQIEILKSWFQSTRLREARLKGGLTMVALLSFNPRACGRRDQIAIGSKAALSVSIHAPAGGATGYQLASIPIGMVSIHAPAGGATF